MLGSIPVCNGWVTTKQKLVCSHSAMARRGAAQTNRPRRSGGPAAAEMNRKISTKRAPQKKLAAFLFGFNCLVGVSA